VAQRESHVLGHIRELEALAADEEDAHLARAPPRRCVASPAFPCFWFSHGGAGALPLTRPHRRVRTQAAVADMGGSAEALLTQFGVLDERVARVARTAAHIGDRLAGVDAARRRAERAVDLISALSLFDTDGAPALGPLFTSDARIAEAAALTHTLLSLAELGAAAGLASCARALARLQTYANSLENRLVAQFDAAEARRNASGMAAAAATLTRFNGGASCVARFVATRPMFLTMGPGGPNGTGGEDDPSSASSAAPPPPANEADAVATATEGVRALGAQFKELLRGAREDAVTVAAVFPAAGAVMATLVTRLLEQRVRSAVESAMPPPPPDDEPAAAAAPRRLARLLLVAGAYERTMELAARLAALPGCGGAPLDAVAAADELFVTWRERYLDDELATQRGLGEGDPFGMAGAEARLARAGDALARCAMLVRAPAARAAAAAALVHALCVEIIRHARAGLDGARAATAGRIKAHTPATPAATAVAEGAGALLEEAGRACSLMAALQRHLADAAAPLLAADPGARAAAADSARQAGMFVEAALALCLQSAVAAAAAVAERTLVAEQSKSDFAPRAVGSAVSGDTGAVLELTADRPTVACMRVTLALGRVHAAAASALDAHNCAAFCIALAGRLAAALEPHVTSFRYTPAGGLRLKRDLAEYGALTAAWGVPADSAVPRRLAELGALANLLVAPKPALALLLGGEGLGLAVPREEGIRWLALRADFRKGDRPFSTLV
jgi:hypothetical protein